MAMRHTPRNPDARFSGECIGQPTFRKANRLNKRERSIGDGDGDPTRAERPGENPGSNEQRHKASCDRCEEPYYFELRTRCGAAHNKAAAQVPDTDRKNKCADIR